MAYLPRPRWGYPPFKIAAIYLILAVLWIIFSDQLVAMLFADAYHLTLAQTLKGWFFVGSTAVVIYVLLRRELATYQRTADNLRQASQELRDLLDAMPVGVALTDGVNLEYINVNFSERFGYSLDEIPTEEQWFVLAFPDPGYREPLVAQWRRDLEQARGQGSAVRAFEVRIQCKNGEVRQAITNTQLIGSHIVVIFTDITERELLHHELVKMQKLESIGMLAGGIAHDFNNILTGIMGNLSYAQVLLDPGHPARVPLISAEHATTRAVELTGQLLTFARGGEPVKQVLSPGALITESMHLLLRGSAVKGQHEIAGDLDCVEADGGQLSQVFNNLIINAIQAMPDGGLLHIIAENLRIGPQDHPSLAPGRYVRVQLRDNGPGMRPEILERIFDPYFTTKEDGSGLGLAMAYSIINRHGGSLIAESTAGEGSLFTLILPATTAAPAAVAIAPPTCNPVRERPPLRLLVMDDEAAICEIASAMLLYLGYEVETCTDGVEAVNMYTQAQADGRPFAAVIMDLTVPGGLGGRETAQRILALDSQACLIVSSGYSHDPVLAEYVRHGFKGVLAKPYKVGDLQQVLAMVLPR